MDDLSFKNLKEYHQFKKELTKIKNLTLINEHWSSCVFENHNSYENVLSIDSYELLDDWENNQRCYNFSKYLKRLEADCVIFNKFFAKHYIKFDDEFCGYVYDYFYDASLDDLMSEVCNEKGFSYLEQKEIENSLKIKSTNKRTTRRL